MAAEDPRIPLITRKDNVKGYSQEMSTPDSANKVCSDSWNHKGTEKTSKFSIVRDQLEKRKQLIKYRKLVADIGLVIALFGIILMLIEFEFVFHYEDFCSACIPLRICMSVSTVFLLGFIVLYHGLNIKCEYLDSDWRLAMSASRTFGIVLELVVCAIHPFPGVPSLASYTQNGVVHLVSVSALLAIPMFLRLYLACRVVRLHYNVLNDPASQSLGAFSRINYSFSFIFKIIMHDYSHVVLLIMTVTVGLISAWLVRACELLDTGSTATDNYLDALWFTYVTFLTVGYGDISPKSICGRTIAVSTGFIGVGVTALLVATITQKLTFTNTQRYVHNFFSQLQMESKYRTASANLLKASWKVYKCRKQGQKGKMLKQKRRLLGTINDLQGIKDKQRQLKDSIISVPDVLKRQGETFNKVEDIEIRLSKVERMMEAFQDTMSTMVQQLNQLIIYKPTGNSFGSKKALPVDGIKSDQKQ